MLPECDVVPLLALVTIAHHRRVYSEYTASIIEQAQLESLYCAYKCENVLIHSRRRVSVFLRIEPFH